MKIRRVNRFNKSSIAVEGFTIIESLMVLTIAGVILYLVFLALPALQRNSRNTQRQKDVTALLEAYSVFTTNNSGITPTYLTSPAFGQVEFCTSSLACDNSASTAHVSYYTSGVWCGGAVACGGGYVYLMDKGLAPNQLSGVQDDYVIIVYGVVCDANGDNGTSIGDTRQFVALYVIEAGSTPYSQKCQNGN